MIRSSFVTRYSSSPFADDTFALGDVRVEALFSRLSRALLAARDSPLYDSSRSVR